MSGSNGAKGKITLDEICKHLNLEITEKGWKKTGVLNSRTYADEKVIDYIGKNFMGVNNKRVKKIIVEILSNRKLEERFVMAFKDLRKKRAEKIKESFVKDERPIKELLSEYCFFVPDENTIDGKGYVLQPLDTDLEFRQTRQNEEAYLPIEELKLESDFTYLEIKQIPEPSDYYATKRVLMGHTHFEVKSKELYKSYCERCEAQGRKCLSFDGWLSSEIHKYFKSPICVEKTFKEIAWADDRGVEKRVRAARVFNYKKILTRKRTLIKDGKMSMPAAWKEVISRMDYPKTFCRWVGVLFFSEKQSSQTLWLRGEGGDGKTTLINVLCELLSGVSATMPLATHRNQFTAAKFYRKRLAVMDDTRDARGIDDGFIFSFTGGGRADIERKGSDSFQGRNNCMLFVTSNKLPRIDVFSPAHLRRLLLINIKPKSGSSFGALDKDETFEDRLHKEAYGFLAYCHDLYQGLQRIEQKRLIDRLGEDNVYAKFQKIHVSSVPVPRELKDQIREKCMLTNTKLAIQFCKEELTIAKGLKENIYDVGEAFTDYLIRHKARPRNSKLPRGAEYNYLRSVLKDKGCDDSEGVIIEGAALKNSLSEQITEEQESFMAESGMGDLEGLL